MKLWLVALLCGLEACSAVLRNRSPAPASSRGGPGGASPSTAVSPPAYPNNRVNTGNQLSRPIPDGSRSGRMPDSRGRRPLGSGGAGRGGMNRNTLLRAMYARQLDGQEFAAMTAMTNPRLAGTAFMDHRMDINSLPSYRYAMSLDPTQPQYRKARQYVKLTGMMESRGSDRGMVTIFSRLLQSTDPTIQRLLRIDAADGAFGDVAKRMSLSPGGFRMLKQLGPMAYRLLM